MNSLLPKRKANNWAIPVKKASANNRHRKKDTNNLQGQHRNCHFTKESNIWKNRRADDRELSCFGRYSRRIELESSASAVSSREFSGGINCEYSASRMAGRFRFLLVKLRAPAGITSKGIIAGGLSGLEMGMISFPFRTGTRGDGNVALDATESSCT